MCLEVVCDLSDISNSQNFRKGVGWKLFFRDLDNSNILNFEYQKHAKSRIVPFDRWLHSKKEVEDFGPPLTIKYDNSHISYAPDFHIYLRKGKIRKGWGYWNRMVWVKVKFKEAHTFGYQNNKPVIVARKMYVPNPRAED